MVWSPDSISDDSLGLRSGGLRLEGAVERTHAFWRAAANVEDAVWCRSISRLFAGETTKSAMEVFLGPPSVKTNLALWGGTRLKDWWWFQAEGVPVLDPPLLSIPVSARSTHHDRDGLLLEKLKLSRGTTPWVFAEAHTRGWAQTVRDAQTQPMIAAGTVAASAAYYLQVARARLTLWAAADASIVSRLSDASVAIDRCILVPVYVEEDIMALVPDTGYFGVACTKGQLAEQSVRLAREVGVSPSTNLVNVTMNSLEGRDYVFSAVATAPPSAAGGMRIGDASWRTLSELHGVKSFAYASLAMRRELQLRQASGDAPLVIGALGGAVPLVPNAMGSAWSSAPDDASAPAEWLLFLETRRSGGSMSGSGDDAVRRRRRQAGELGAECKVYERCSARDPRATSGQGSFGS